MILSNLIASIITGILVAVVVNFISQRLARNQEKIKIRGIDGIKKRLNVSDSELKEITTKINKINEFDVGSDKYNNTIKQIQELVNFKDVFFSYSSSDKQLAERIYNDLSNKGVRVWYDKHELNIGDNLMEGIDRGIRLSKFFIVLISKSYLNSKWAGKEIKALQEKEFDSNRILPIIIEDLVIDEMPIILKDRVFLDLTSNYEEGINRLVKLIKE